MFSFFTRKKQPALTDYGFVGVDMHSHLIPGIDDGVPDMETALEALTQLQNLGYRKVVTTPHVIQDMYPNTSAVIRQGVAEVQAAAKEHGLTIEIEAAAEYLLDEYFMALLHKGDLLTFGSNYLLFELSFAVPPLNLEDLVFQMMTRGYRPILAHPERYSYLKDHPERIKNLRDQGCLLQLNILSLYGQYGSRAQQQARYFLEHGMIDFLGTDMHRVRDAEKMKQLISAKESAIMGGKTFLNASL
ncbi:tyrosine-protein phosphatase [Tellurirhabdus bombi]|uniref:tyrosine-protein phosphatase n=1 Tax=Tellurirhabdus bombi TaxID=2907205 RepID=UPI001F3A5404|nr:CpsB/CapC family capsule biosynthesis tyrosine phosphatase [Tellurirhabdus bombi]